MNLDKPELFKQLDTTDILREIEDLPNQLKAGWDAGYRLPLPSWLGIRQVILAGMGPAGLASDLVGAYLASTCPLPVVTHSDYDLPAWAGGEQTLVIAVSCSGSTQETISACLAAVKNHCRVLTIGQPGSIAGNETAHWSIESQNRPEFTLGFISGMLLAAFYRLKIVPSPELALHDAVHAMQAQQAGITAAIPLADNPAKRLAGQLMGRWINVVGAGVMAPVSRVWKAHLNLLAKAWAQSAVLPDADHNLIAGIFQPQEILGRSMVIFLRSPSDLAHNRLRSNLTRKTLMLEGIGTDTYDAPGETPLANQWTGVQFGCFVAYYLALSYGVDPNPEDLEEAIQQELKQPGLKF